MNRVVGIVLLIAAIVLGLPYLFYALLYHGIPGYAWVLLCLIAFLTATLRWRAAPLGRLLLIAVIASAAVSSVSLPLMSATLTGLLLLCGVLVFGSFVLGVSRLADARGTGGIKETG